MFRSAVMRSKYTFSHRSCAAGTFGNLSVVAVTARLIVRFELVDLEAETNAFLCKPNLISTHCVIGPLPYIGGKNRIANKIIAIFPEHKTYVEAFAGGAQVLFHKKPSQVEVLNDLDGEVVNFFRVCQQHHEELLRQLRFILVSRKWFELFEKQSPESLTDVQRAVRFFYLQKNSYAGLVRAPVYHWHVIQPPGYNPQRLPEIIQKTHERLRRVQIECLPYEQVIERFDRPSTLFYLDPPYFGRKLYKFNFEEADFVALEQRLATLHGKFVLSLNDVPKVRRIFQRFHFREISFAYTAQQSAGKRYREVLITNFVIREPNPEAKP